jgi:alpha-L-fucosidase
MREQLNALFRDDVALKRPAPWQATGDRTAAVEIDLGQSTSVSIADLREDITHGQRVAHYTLEGRDEKDWKVLKRGNTIGCRKLDRFNATTVRHVRLTITEAVDTPRPVKLGLFA